MATLLRLNQAIYLALSHLYLLRTMLALFHQFTNLSIRGFFRESPIPVKNFVQVKARHCTLKGIPTSNGPTEKPEKTLTLGMQHGEIDQTFDTQQIQAPQGGRCPPNRLRVLEKDS